MNSVFDALPYMILGALKSPGQGIYTHQNSAAVPVNLIFDASYRLVQEQDGVPVEVLRKAATVAASDIPTPRHGDTLQYAGETYTVRGVVPSGAMNTLILSE